LVSPTRRVVSRRGGVAIKLSAGLPMV
jgi:hypothetical protein